jgi:hypothetical protein
MRRIRRLGGILAGALAVSGPGLGVAAASTAPVAGTAGTTTETPSTAAKTRATPGDVQVHSESTPVDVRGDAADVCDFYLDAFDFAPADRIAWTIGAQPPGGEAVAGLRSDTITVGASGQGITENMTLPDGRYRLDWSVGAHAAALGTKSFSVSCAAPSSPAAAPYTAPAGPGAAAGTRALAAGAPATNTPATGTPATGAAAPASAPRPVADAPTEPPSRAGLGGRLADAGTGMRGVVAVAAVLILAGCGIALRRRTS